MKMASGSTGGGDKNIDYLFRSDAKRAFDRATWGEAKKLLRKNAAPIITAAALIAGFGIYTIIQ